MVFLHYTTYFHLRQSRVLNCKVWWDLLSRRRYFVHLFSESHFCFGTDPFLLPPLQVDKGAIRFILSGANIMCPGLTSPGAQLTNVPKDTPVVSIDKTLLYGSCKFPFFSVKLTTS